MSYPRDLDEYSDEELQAELEQRRKLRAAGYCDYCKRPAGCEPCCKFPDRHGVVCRELSTYRCT